MVLLLISGHTVMENIVRKPEHKNTVLEDTCMYSNVRSLPKHTIRRIKTDGKWYLPLHVIHPKVVLKDEADSDNTAHCVTFVILFYYMVCIIKSILFYFIGLFRSKVFDDDAMPILRCKLE